ncbi:hypothetical protein HY491_02465 [Candidatus Woesearchaeota archaeon]|nr:hypothetical protein [Candidatus Woesearchaeota archaeon]
MFSFLKKLRKPKEPEKLAVPGHVLHLHIEEWSAPLLERLSQQLHRYQAGMRGEIAETRQAITALMQARLRNEKIPEQHKILMQGNREIYAKRVQQFLDTLVLPEDYPGLLQFAETFAQAMESLHESTQKSYAVLQQFLADEAYAVASSLKKLEQLTKDIMALVGELNLPAIDLLKRSVQALQKSMAAQGALNSEIESVEQRLKQLQAEHQQLLGKLEQFKQGESFRQFQGIKADIEQLDQQLASHSQGLVQAIRLIEHPLKKYGRFSQDENLILAYLRDPVTALLNDPVLHIHEVLARLQKSIAADQFSLGEKDPEKILANVRALDLGYLTQFVKQHQELQAAKKSRQEELRSSKAIAEIESLTKQRREKEEQIASVQRERGESIKRYDAINLPEMRQQIAERIKAIFAKEAVIE